MRPSSQSVGRLTSLEHRQSDGTAICTFAYTHDAVGNITRIDREDGSWIDYGYDALDRLTSAVKHIDDQQVEYDLSWTYDAVGNRLTQVKDGVQTDYAYNAANELLSETTNNETTTYAYDGNGSLVTKTDSEGTTTFTWTPEDLIKQLSLPSGVQDSFEYDGGGARVEITDSTGATRYVWDGLDIVAELDTQNALTRAYAHGYTPVEGAYSLVTQHDVSSNADYFYHEDRVGGIHALTDAPGSVADTYAFLPFGEITSQTGDAPNRFVFPATYVSLIEFSGRTFRLSPTRVCAVDMGRFARREVDLRSWAMGDYAFALSCPTGIVDPSGRTPGYKKLTIEECNELLKKLIRLARHIHRHIRDYDAKEDARGGHRKHGGGKTRPYGHRKEILDKQSRLREQLKKWDKRCRDPYQECKRLVPLPSWVRDVAHENLPSLGSPKAEVPEVSWLIEGLAGLPGDVETYQRIGDMLTNIGIGIFIGVGGYGVIAGGGAAEAPALLEIAY